MKKAIVLSGGGSKGAYQIGVWKALRKLKISYDIVTGTSVGALNAALFVQQDYWRGLWLWFNMDFKLIFDDKIDADYSTKEGKNVILKTYAQAVVDGGMNIERLERTVEKSLNVKKIYSSLIDLGIVTVKLPTLKPILLQKKDIPKHQLKDYLIASASCFPAFQKKKIGDDSYIDGGLYDNLPINLAIEMGATEVIAVDLEEVGFKKKVKDASIPITYIKPNNDIGSFLVFNKTMARRCIRFGYNDTMKVFGKLDGEIYTFKKNHLKKNYDRYFATYLEQLRKCLYQPNTKEGFWDNLLKISVLKHFLIKPKHKETIQKWNREMERLGKTMEMEECKIYDIHKWNAELIQKYYQLKSDPIVEENLKNNKFKILFNNQYTIKYLVDLMLQNRIPHKKLYRMALLFPHEFLQALYLKTIIIK